jgi:hypothetical protein
MTKITKFLHALFTFIGVFVTILWLAAFFNIGNFVLYYGGASQIYIDTQTKQIKEIK